MRLRVRSIAIAASLAIAGCHGSIKVDLPIEGDPETIVIVARGAGSAPPQAFAYQRPFNDAYRIDLREETALTAVLYSRSLDELQLQQGPLQLVAPAVPGRPLPSSQIAMYAAALAPSGFSGWKMAQDDTPIADVRLEPFDWMRCIGLSGCASASDDDECAIPCPMPAPPLDPQPVVPPCPNDWEVDKSPRIAGLCTCTPRIPTHVDCLSDATIAFYGETVCAPLGAPCPAGEWSDTLTGRTDLIYVRAGSGSIMDAIASAPSGDAVIALSAGLFDEAILIDRPGIEIVGACAEKTRIARTITVIAPATVISDLTIIGPGRGIILAGGALSLQAVRVHTEGDVGVFAGGGELTAYRLAIDGPNNHSLRIEGSAVAIHRAEIHGAKQFGASALHGSLELGEARISGGSTSTIAGGVWADDGSEVTVHNAMLEGLPGAAFSGAMRSAISIRDVIVDGGPSPGHSGGLNPSGGRVTIARSLFQHLAQGLASDGELHLEDTILRGIASPMDPKSTRAILAGTKLDVSRVLIDGVSGTGIQTRGTDLSGTDLAIRVDPPEAACLGGTETLSGNSGGQIELTRVHLAGGSLLIAPAGPTGSISDLRIEGSACTAATFNGERGFSLDRVSIKGPHSIGISVKQSADPPPQPILISNVVIHSTTMQGTALAPLRGLAKVTSFGIDSHATGVLLCAPATLDLMSGEIRNNQRAFSGAAARDLRSLLEGVLLEGNGAPFSTVVDECRL